MYRYLRLFGNDFSSAGAVSLVGALASLPNVERIDLDNNASDDVEIDPTRMSASTSGNHIGDSGAEALAAALVAAPIASLRVLNMGGNEIGDRGVAALCTLVGASQLRQMNLLRNTFSVAAAHELVKATLARKGVNLCSGLSGIDSESEVASLVSAGLGDSDGVLIACSLWSCGPLPMVKELRLHDNLLGDAAAAAIADAISGGSLPGLLTLTLNNNCIGDAGFAALAVHMRPDGALARLETMGLRQNLLADGAMAALASNLGPGSMPALRQLLLGSNVVTDEGLTQLAGALSTVRALPALEVLELQKNQIGDPGAQALATAIATGALPKLKELYIFHNALSPQGESAIRSTGAPALGRVVATLPKLFSDE